jgi:hypothetical protein
MPTIPGSLERKMQLSQETDNEKVATAVLEEEIVAKPECSAVAVDHIWYDSLGD